MKCTNCDKEIKVPIKKVLTVTHPDAPAIYNPTKYFCCIGCKENWIKWMSYEAILGEGCVCK